MESWASWWAWWFSLKTATCFGSPFSSAYELCSTELLPGARGCLHLSELFHFHSHSFPSLNTILILKPNSGSWRSWQNERYFSKGQTNSSWSSISVSSLRFSSGEASDTLNEAAVPVALLWTKKHFYLWASTEPARPYHRRYKKECWLFDRTT